MPQPKSPCPGICGQANSDGFDFNFGQIGEVIFKLQLPPNHLNNLSSDIGGGLGILFRGLTAMS
jgi:hypothetical protein